MGREVTNKQILDAISSLKIELGEEMKSIQTSCKDSCNKVDFVKISNESLVKINNTCAFHALCQVIAAAYIYNENYRIMVYPIINC